MTQQVAPRWNIEAKLWRYRPGQPMTEHGAAPASPKVRIAVGNTTAPLVIESVRCPVPNEERYEHCRLAIEAAERYQFPVLVGNAGSPAIERPCVLVGSGPSAVAMLPEIRARYGAGEEIIAIKGAHDWLIKNGIVPRAAVAVDAQRSRAKCFRRVTEGVLYLLASQMHPDTWPYMAARKARVLIWHSRIGAEQENREGWARTFLVPCASMSGTSAIVLLYLLGRRVFDLYGFESSLPELASPWQRLLARLRGRPLKLDGARVPAEQRVIEVDAGGQRFKTTPVLVHQVQEVLALLKVWPELTLRAHGRGYLQALLSEGR